MVQSLRHHYIAMFIDYKAVFIRCLASKRNVESGNRGSALHREAEPHSLGRMGGDGWSDVLREVFRNDNFSDSITSDGSGAGGDGGAGFRTD